MLLQIMLYPTRNDAMTDKKWIFERLNNWEFMTTFLTVYLRKSITDHWTGKIENCEPYY